MRDGERPVDTALRCLSEELGVAPRNVEILEDVWQPRHVQRESPSSPGLTTKYAIHTVKTGVVGLPDADFWTDESDRHSEDPVVRHRWVWSSDREASFDGQQIDGS
jgi:hypothetical protein